jgi:hypothetical protein
LILRTETWAAVGLAALGTDMEHEEIVL